MRVRIVEFADELKNYNYYQDEKIIALNPCSQSYFKNRNIQFENSLNFFGLEGHIAISKKSKKIMESVNNLYSFNDKHNLKICYSACVYDWILLYLRYLLITLYIIDKIIKKYNPTEVIIPKSTSIENFDSYCSPKDRLLGHLVKKYIKGNNLNIKIIEEENNKIKTNTNFQSIKKNSKKIISYISFVIFKFFFRKKNIYFVTDDSHNINTLVDLIKLKKPDLKPVFFSLSKGGLIKYGKSILKGSIFSFFLGDFFLDNKDKKKIQKSINDFNYNLSTSSSVKHEITYKKVNLLDEVNLFISSVVLKNLIEFNSKVNILVKIIKISNPKFMISQHTRLMGCAFGELSNIYKIPAMVISHGSHVYHEEPEANFEWEVFSKAMINKIFPYIAAQNLHMLNFLEKSGYSKDQIVNTGPLIYKKFDTSKERIKELKKNILKENCDKKIILHAGTPKVRGSNRLYVYETTDEYIQNINDMISVIEKKKNIFFAIKFREEMAFKNSPRLAFKDFEKLIKKSDCCKIFHDGNFSDFLSVSDLMISYSSTTIDEALYNRVPILLYDPHKKYSHIKASTVMPNMQNPEDGIFYCSELNGFDLAIDEILKNKEIIQKNDIIWKKHIMEENKNKEWLSYLVK